VSYVYVLLLPAVFLTNFMQQRPSWEANSHPASQEIPPILWNPKFHYGVFKSPPLNPILNQLIHYTPCHLICLTSILISSSHLRLGISKPLPFTFSDQNLIWISNVSHTCYMLLPSHPPGFDCTINIRRSVCYKTAHYSVFSNLFQLPLS
jgi:hypothetical protein